ncbi:MAG: hypothetical protein U0746_17150 [Gemmataceae bacterium]
MYPCIVTRQRIAVAAELRVNGASWSAVAEQLGCRVGTARRWPRLYPDLWADAMRDAHRERRTEFEAEALTSLRKLLRSADAKYCHAAARDLLVHHRGRPRAARRVANPSAGLPDEQLRALADDFLADGPGGESPP